MSSHRVSKLIGFATFFILGIVNVAHAEEDRRFQLTGIGRFTYLVDLDTVSREGDVVRLRSLQVTPEPMKIGNTLYIGGYSWWHFDCAAQMASRLDYASLMDDFSEGPTTPINAPPYAIAKGGDADELAQVGCGVVPQEVSARSIIEAIALSRED